MRDHLMYQLGAMLLSEDLGEWEADKFVDLVRQTASWSGVDLEVYDEDIKSYAYTMFGIKDLSAEEYDAVRAGYLMQAASILYELNLLTGDQINTFRAILPFPHPHDWNLLPNNPDLQWAKRRIAKEVRCG